MVEIGVDRAEYANHFLLHWHGTHYWGVDDYRHYPEMEFDRQADYQIAIIRLERFARRAKLVKMRSVDASRLFEPGSIDFVYIDGSHQYQDVLNDISAWWPILSDKGILAGHDFDDQEIHAGVKEAVTQFARGIDQTVYLTSVEGFDQETCPSWYIYRSGMPGSDWRRC